MVSYGLLRKTLKYLHQVDLDCWVFSVMFLIDVAEMRSKDEPTSAHTPHPLYWCTATARASYASADVEYTYTGDSWRMLASADWFAVETAILSTHTHTPTSSSNSNSRNE